MQRRKIMLDAVEVFAQLLGPGVALLRLPRERFADHGRQPQRQVEQVGQIGAGPRPEISGGAHLPRPRTHTQPVQDRTQGVDICADVTAHAQHLFGREDGVLGSGFAWQVGIGQSEAADLHPAVDQVQSIRTQAAMGQAGLSDGFEAATGVDHGAQHLALVGLWRAVSAVIGQADVARPGIDQEGATARFIEVEARQQVGMAQRDQPGGFVAQPGAHRAAGWGLAQNFDQDLFAVAQGAVAGGDIVAAARHQRSESRQHHGFEATHDL